ncbi:DUF2339 domain-containing protein [candidate division KSB1 bacterium]|nr:DUF2339 domain-containing protein [candidate division KSB1 bacterium]
MFAFIFVIVVLFGIFFYIRINQLNYRMKSLEQQIWHLQQRIVTPPPAKTILKSASQPDGGVIVPAEKIQTPVQPGRKEIATQTKQSKVPRLPTTRNEWEALLGGKISNWIGALALIIGFGFFLQHAFENQWITEVIRIIAGVIVGVLLVLVGMYYYRKAMPIFAQGLLGTGIAILYLTIYAAFNFYELISQPLAMIFMSLVTISAFLLALKYDSPAISLLGLIGGFLTPFMLSSNQDNPLGLFTYLAILNLGLVAILFIKFYWIWLQPFALFGTYLIYFLWSGAKFTSDDWIIALVFGTIFWLYFFALDFRYILKKVETYTRIRHLMAILNSVCFYIALVEIFDVRFPDWQAEMALVLSMVYFISLLFIRNFQSENQNVLNRYSLTAIILLIIATILKFDDFELIIGLSLEAVILFGCGWYYRMSKVWWSALALFGMAILRLLIMDETYQTDPINSFKLFINLRALTFFVLISSFVITQFLTKRLNNKFHLALEKLVILVWSALLFLFVTMETLDYFRFQIAQGADEKFLLSIKIFVLMIIWIFLAVLYHVGGIRFKNLMALYISGIVAFCTSLMVFGFGLTIFHPIELFHPVFNFRSLCFLILVISFAFMLLFQRHEMNWSNWLKWTKPVFFFLIILIGFFWLTREIFDYFEFKKFLFNQQPVADQGMIDLVSNQQQLFLSAGWLFYSIFLLVFGIGRRLGNLRLISMILFGMTIFKIFIFDLSFLTSFHRIFSFIGLGVVLLVVSYLYHRYKYLILDE